MAITLKTAGKASAMPAGLALGAAISTAITILMAGILAFLVNTERIPWENIGYGIIFLLLLASFTGALSAYGMVKRQRLMVCAISGLLYMAILLSITALFFGGQYQAVGVTAAVVFAGSGCAALLGLSGGRTRKGRRIRKAHR